MVKDCFVCGKQNAGADSQVIGFAFGENRIPVNLHRCAECTEANLPKGRGSGAENKTPLSEALETALLAKTGSKSAASIRVYLW